MGSRSPTSRAISPFMNVNDGGDMSQTLKLKIVCMGIKPTVYLFIGMFVGVVVRGKFFGLLARIIMTYRMIYEVVWFWRYNGRNMAHEHENFSHAYRNFFFT